MKKYNYTFISIFFVYLIILFCIFIYFFFLQNFITIPSCPFYTYLGFFCPACGGTRALTALLHFDIISSLYFNPIVLYTFIFSTLYLLTEFINIKFNKKIKFPSTFILTLGLCILFFNCILKNIF